MADIDKGLPNTRTKLEIPSEEELQAVELQEPVEEKGPIEVVPEEDGGATIDFEPGAINIPGTESHFDNLADILPEENLEPIGNEMVQNYMDYKGSRKDSLTRGDPRCCCSGTSRGKRTDRGHTRRGWWRNIRLRARCDQRTRNRITL